MLPWYLIFILVSKFTHTQYSAFFTNCTIIAKLYTLIRPTRLAKHSNRVDFKSNVFLLACGTLFPTMTCAAEKQHDIEQHIVTNGCFFPFMLVVFEAD